MEQFPIKSVFMQAPFVMVKETNTELNETVKQLVELARYNLQRRDGGDAVLKYYKDALMLYKSPSLFVEAAFAFFVQEKYYKAHEMLNKAREINKDCPEVYYNLALIFYCLGDYQSAASLFGLIVSTQDMSTEIKAYSHNFLGCISTRFEDLIKAREHLQEACTLLPDFVPPYNNAALVELFEKKETEAIEWLNKALALDATCPEALNNLGVIQYNLGEYEAALTYFNKAQQKESCFYGAYQNAQNVTKLLGTTSITSDQPAQLEDTTQKPRKHVHGQECAH